MAMRKGEGLTEGVEGLDGHPLEEPGEQALLGFAVRVEPQLHQHQEGGVKQEAEEETGRATGVVDEGDEGVAGGQRPIEVKSEDTFHFEL